MTDDNDTPLALALKARIREFGPISVATYMAACLSDPEHGYYTSRPAIGAPGDFITAPEISQIFGEIIGLWTAVVREQMGQSVALRLVELGPGRGTLMRDVLRVMSRVPRGHDGLTVDLVESNATLRVLQQGALRDEKISINWHAATDLLSSLDTPTGDGGTIVLANEFLDALPVEQFVHTSGQWHRRGVSVDPSGAFEFCVLEPVDGIAPGLPAQKGDIFETRPSAEQLISLLASTFREHGPFAALLIDYGHPHSAVGETLQAVRQQAYVSPFEAPGLCDMSAHVNFEAIATHAVQAGLEVDGPVSQGAFLGALGALGRASRLMAANPDKAGEIEAGIARLISPNGMGSRFKVMAVRSSDLPPLPGLVGLDNPVAPA